MKNDFFTLMAVFQQQSSVLSGNTFSHILSQGRYSGQSTHLHHNEALSSILYRKLWINDIFVAGEWVLLTIITLLFSVQGRKEKAKDSLHVSWPISWCARPRQMTQFTSCPPKLLSLFWKCFQLLTFESVCWKGTVLVVTNVKLPVFKDFSVNDNRITSQIL